MDWKSLEEEIGEVDEHFKDAVQVVTQYDRASASLLQRRLQTGYARAARVIDQLEAAGIIGPAHGSDPREVLIKSPKELFGENWDKLTKKDEEKAHDWPSPSRDPFDNIYFWFKVLKVSLIVLVPYGLFGFEAGVLVGIILIALFLSKISLTLLEINDDPLKRRRVTSTSKSQEEGKIVI